MLLVAVCFWLILFGASRAMALGGSTSVDTYDDLKPKDPRMTQIEDSMYNIANGAMAGLTTPLPAQQGLPNNSSNPKGSITNATGPNGAYLPTNSSQPGMNYAGGSASFDESTGTRKPISTGGNMSSTMGSGPNAFTTPQAQDIGGAATQPVNLGGQGGAGTQIGFTTPPADTSGVMKPGADGLYGYEGVQGHTVGKPGDFNGDGRVLPGEFDATSKYNVLYGSGYRPGQGYRQNELPYQQGSVTEHMDNDSSVNPGGYVMEGWTQGDDGLYYLTDPQGNITSAPSTNQPGAGSGGGLPQASNITYDPRSGAPQVYDNNTVIGQLFNDAMSKQYMANGRYDDLVDQAGQYTNNIDQLLRGAENAGYHYANEAGTDLNSARDQLGKAEGMYGLSQAQLGEAARALGLSEEQLGMAAGELGNANRVLGQAETAGDPWYAQAQDAYDKANGLIDNQVDTLNIGKGVNQWYDDSARDSITQSKNLMATGEIPQAIKDAMTGTVNRQLESGMGTMLNDLAGRGVVNSSVTGAGINGLAQNAANAYQDMYSQNLFNLIGAYDGSANTAATAGKAFSDSYLNMANGYNNAANSATSLGRNLADTGSMRVGDLTNIAKGYQGNAQGYQNNASGYQGAATGYQNNATGYNNIAAGYQNNAAGYQNNAQGWNQTGSTLADTLLGTAGGYNNLLNSNLTERQDLMGDVQDYWTNAWGPMSPVMGYLTNQQNDRARDTQTTVVNQRRGFLS